MASKEHLKTLNSLLERMEGELTEKEIYALKAAVRMNTVTVRDAASKWVNEFDSISTNALKVLLESEDVYRPLNPYTEYEDFEELNEEELEELSDEEREEYEKNLKYKEECYKFENGEYPVYGYPSGWGTSWSPQSIDQKWIENNLIEINEIGFLIYETEELGYVLAIDAGGFDFYEAFWIPLYKLRGLEWHTVE